MLYKLYLGKLTEKMEQVNKKEALKCNYGKPYSYANCIMIGEFKK